MKSLTIIALIISLNASAFSAYYPNGKKVTIQFQSIQELLDSLGIKEVTSHDTKSGAVYFKRLSNKPVVIFFFEKEAPSRIKEMIASYNYTEYINSYSYYYDLTNMKDSGTLTKEYLNDVFGNPSATDTNTLGVERLTFKNYNCVVEFDQDKAISVDVRNYNAISKNGLSIVSFKAIGDDYSIGMEISVGNHFAKTIKYIQFTVTATNPVHDKVGTKTVQGVGPIEKSETGSYEFGTLFYSRTAKYLKLKNIKIIYMDGTQRIIPQIEIEKIRLVDWEEYGKRTE